MFARVRSSVGDAGTRSVSFRLADHPKLALPANLDRFPDQCAPLMSSIAITQAMAG